MPIPTSMTTCMQIEDDDGSVFIIPSSKKGQFPIIFNRMHPWIATPVDSDENLKPPQFFRYALSVHCIMKEMGYDLRREGLNFGKGKHIPLQPFEPKENPTNYYNQTRRGLEYVTPPTQSELETDKSLPSHSSYSSDLELNISVVVIFKNLFVNLTLISHADHDEDVEMFDTDLWAQQLNFQWERHFKQCEPPTKDKVIQVNVDYQANPKLISISES